MSTCCAPFGRLADEQFDRKRVAAELKRYHAKGPGATTRLLEDEIAAGGVSGTLLDVGSGIGALTFRMLDRGVTHAVAVDASSAYIDAARDEARRVGRADDVTFVHADFLAVARDLPPAAVVTLDRVVCCYPSWQPLLAAALQHADQCLALSYPRNLWFVRLGNAVENGQRWVTRNDFRTFVHPSTRIEAQIRAAGFTLVSRCETWVWSIDVYRR
jgi:SAM-dependent methyltransferase